MLGQEIVVASHSKRTIDQCLHHHLHDGRMGRYRAREGRLSGGRGAELAGGSVLAWLVKCTGDGQERRRGRGASGRPFRLQKAEGSGELAVLGARGPGMGVF